MSHNNRQITYSMQAIRVFEAAARLGSFKQAAIELNLTPTAVSHQIRNLESQLKLTLFVRKTRAVTLTEEGHHLSLATSQGLRVIEDAIQTLSQNNHAIRVSTTSSFAALVLIPKLVNLQQHYPELDVAVTTGEDHDQQRETLPVRYGDLSQVAKEQQLGRDSFNLYCSPRLVCEANQPVPLYSTQWKNPHLPPLPLTLWLQRETQQGKNYHLQYFDQELYGIQEAIQGNGWVFCAERLVQTALDHQQLQPMGSPIASNLGYYIPQLPQRENSRNRQFLDWLRDEVFG